MWLSPGHRFFSNRCRSHPGSRVGKKLRADFAAPILSFFWLLFGHCGNAPENALAQMASTEAPPAAAVDFDQTLGMPPYVFRIYQFAATDPGKVRVEVFIGMVNDILQFVKMPPDAGPDSSVVLLNENQGYRAQYEVNITIWDKQKNPVDSRNWKRELVVNNFDATNDRKKLNREHAAFDLPPGEYEIALEITDRDTGKNLRERKPLKLSSHADDELRLSSLVLTKPAPEGMTAPRDSLLQHYAAITMNLPVAARLPEQAGEATAKNAREMAGAAAYFEIYGAPIGETLQLQYQLLDWRRQVLQEWQETLTVSQTPARHFVDFAGKINQAGLHTFHLVVQSRPSFSNIQQESRDGAKLKSAEAEESFRVQISADRNDAAKLVGNNTLLYEPLRYIVKGAEYKRLSETDGATRDSLVAAFWRQRDPDPAAAGNQLQDEFYRRVAFADLRFASASTGKSGWESDRGRIYIKYGPPREVHNQFAEQGASPYEIWLYPDLDLAFIFRDKTGSGDFELVNR